jgi:hypothetical protein
LTCEICAESSTAKDFWEVILKLVLVDTGYDSVLFVVHIGVLSDFNDDLLGSQIINTGVNFTVSTITGVDLDNLKAFLKYYAY